MRYLILSDIHANWEALAAVLADAEGDYDTVLNCGDLVGYGPDPNRVVDWCRQNNQVIVRGNHDKACAGLLDPQWFNPVARTSTEWTQRELTEVNREYLRDLAKGPRAVDGFEILHGSPLDEDEYLVHVYEIGFAARRLEMPLGFFGHTHLQGAYLVHRNGVKELPPVFEIEETARYMINSGSVGQPRDDDPRAAYAIYDTGEHVVELRRVSYDIEKTQQKILRAGLPEVLAARLEFGT
ncbi:MAG: metallophosphoesterase family protein [Acidobacteria bacterium]|nr:metallophosphoesterase family protein [Acidobacteriota bacterium]MBI3281723.1 metallophosphoesterase family protein [Acidobacteriota bacterium]